MSVIGMKLLIRKSRKGQVAFEFLLIYGVLILLFLGATVAITQRAFMSQIYAEQVFAREIAMQFANEIDLAARLPGYERYYEFPRTIRGMNYSVTISGGLLELEYSSVTPVVFFYPLSTKNVTKQYYGSTFAIDTTKGYMILRNENGGVVIYQ